MNKLIAIDKILNIARAVAYSFRDAFYMLLFFGSIFLVAFWVKIGLGLLGI